MGAVARAAAGRYRAAPQYRGADRRDRPAFLGGHLIRQELVAGKGGHGHRPAAAPATRQREIPPARPHQDGDAAHHAGVAGRVLGDLRLGIRAGAGDLDLHSRDGARDSDPGIWISGGRAGVHSGVRRIHSDARRQSAADSGFADRAGGSAVRVGGGAGRARNVLCDGAPDLGGDRALWGDDQHVQSDSGLAARRFAGPALALRARSAGSCWQLHSDYGRLRPPPCCCWWRSAAPIACSRTIGRASRISMGLMQFVRPDGSRPGHGCSSPPCRPPSHSLPRQRW